MGWWPLSETTPKAKWQHTCIWCGQFILKGERHAKVTGTYDGEFQSHRFHVECLEACGKELAEVKEDYFEPHTYKRGSTEPKGCGKVVLA